MFKEDKKANDLYFKIVSQNNGILTCRSLLTERELNLIPDKFKPVETNQKHLDRITKLKRLENDRFNNILNVRFENNQKEVIEFAGFVYDINKIYGKKLFTSNKRSDYVSIYYFTKLIELLHYDKIKFTDIELFEILTEYGRKD